MKRKRGAQRQTTKRSPPILSVEMFNLKRRLSGGSMKSVSSTGSKSRARAMSLPEVPCSIVLDGNVLTLGHNRQWGLDESTMGNFEEQIERLQRHVKLLENENLNLKLKFKEVKGENRMLVFKNELLMELSAVSQMDADRNNEEYQKEALKTEALKWELGKYHMEVA